MRPEFLRLSLQLTRSRNSAAARAIAASLVLGLTTACAGTDSARPRSDDVPPSRSFTLLYSASLLGQLEPCGCSPDMRGGIGRAATLIERVRAEGSPVLLIDGGDRFHPRDASDDPVAVQQQRMQAETLAEITRLLRYDVLIDEPATHLREVGGVTIGIVALGADDDAEVALRQRTAEARERGADLVVAVADRTFEATRTLAPIASDAGVGLLFAARSDHPLTDVSGADPWSDPPLFTLHPRGEELLRIDVVVARDVQTPAKLRPVPGVANRQAELAAIDDRIASLQQEVATLSPGDPMRTTRTEKVLELQERKSALASAPPPRLPIDASAFTWAFVPVAPRVPESRQVRALLDEHDRRVGERNLALARAQPKPCPEAKEGEARFVGDATCATCHPQAMAFWRSTGHARAFQTLEERGKQFSVECVSCHVTGFQRPGGACDIATTEGRRNVQCESCHGAGSVHAATANARYIDRSPSEATCTACHDSLNSPHFNVAAYRQRILGPGHGRDAAQVLPTSHRLPGSD